MCMHAEAAEAAVSFQASWNPTETSNSAVLDCWRQNLAVLAGSHSAGDKAVLHRLGEALLRQRQQVFMLFLLVVA